MRTADTPTGAQFGRVEGAIDVFVAIGHRRLLLDLGRRPWLAELWNSPGVRNVTGVETTCPSWAGRFQRRAECKTKTGKLFKLIGKGGHATSSRLQKQLSFGD